MALIVPNVPFGGKNMLFNDGPFFVLWNWCKVLPITYKERSRSFNPPQRKTPFFRTFTILILGALKVKLSIGTITLLLFSVCAYAQPANDNCAAAQQLCPNIPTMYSNINATTEVGAGLADGATAAGNFCFALDNTVWFTFTTNTIGGNADVDISGISCIGGTGFDTELQGVVIEAGTPCDESTYTSVSNCVTTGAGTFTLSAVGLLPSTTYYVQIDGDFNGAGITDPAECDFNIEVSGPAVDVTVTTTVIDETCGAADGQIDFTSVDGGMPPYTYSIDGATFQAGTSFPGLTSGTYPLYVQDAGGCIFTVGTATVGLTGGPTGTVTTVTASCNANDGEINITGVVGGTTPYSYSINGGPPGASPNFTGLGAGIYTVTITDATGCPTSYTTIILNNSGPTSGTAVVFDASCGNTDGSVTIVGVTGGSTPYTYDIGSGPQASSTFSGLAPGTYSVVITDAFGCEFTVNNIVVAESPGNLLPLATINAGPTTICDGDNVTVNALGVNEGSNPNYEFFVNGTSVQSGSGTSWSSTTLQDGDVITLVLTSDDPCVLTTTANSNTIVITVIPVVTPTVNLVASSTAVCDGDVVDFTATSPDCTTTGTFDWYIDGVLVQSETTGMYSTNSLSNGAVVEVTMTCDDMCSLDGTSNQETITVTTLNVDAGPDVTIYEGDVTTLDGSGTGTYAWIPPGSLDDPTAQDPEASPGATTTYTLCVTQNGCTECDDVTVTVIELVTPPNTFTPNGDGTNDTWQINKIEDYPTAKVTVYDRWGQKIFNSIGYGNGQEWDGTNRGLKLPAATYYYVIDLNSEGGDPDRDVVAGSVTIIY